MATKIAEHRDAHNQKVECPLFSPVYGVPFTSPLIVPCFCIPQARGRYKVYALPPVPVSKESAGDSQAIIRAIHERFEQEITAHPTLWLWVEHRWRLIPYGVSFRGYPPYAKKVFLTREDLRAAA